MPWIGGSAPTSSSAPIQHLLLAETAGAGLSPHGKGMFRFIGFDVKVTVPDEFFQGRDRE